MARSWCSSATWVHNNGLQKSPLANGLKSRCKPCWEHSLTSQRQQDECVAQNVSISFITNAMGKVCSQSYLPVPITQVPELGSNDAGQERSNSALRNKGLCDCSNPEVNIVRCPIQLHERFGQFGIAQHLREFIHVLRLGEPTEAPPGIVTCKSKNSRNTRTYVSPSSN